MKDLYEEFKRNAFNPWYYLMLAMLPIIHIAAWINFISDALVKGVEKVAKYIVCKVK